MSRRPTVTDAEIEKVRALLMKCGARIASVEVDPVTGRWRVLTTDAEDLTLADHLGERERAKERWT